MRPGGPSAKAERDRRPLQQAVLRWNSWALRLVHKIRKGSGLVSGSISPRREDLVASIYSTVTHPSMAAKSGGISHLDYLKVVETILGSCVGFSIKIFST